MIPASYNDDTLPVSGRDDGPARPCARPASEGSLDESTSRLEGMTHCRYRAASAPFPWLSQDGAQRRPDPSAYKGTPYARATMVSHTGGRSPGLGSCGIAAGPFKA